MNCGGTAVINVIFTLYFTSILVVFIDIEVFHKAPSILIR